MPMCLRLRPVAIGSLRLMPSAVLNQQKLIRQEIERFDAGNTVIAVAQIPKVEQEPLNQCS